MMEYLKLIFFLIIFLDAYLTYKSLSLFKKWKPEENQWWKSEQNPIIQPLLKRFGLIKGLLVGVAIILLIWVILAFILDLISRDIILIFYGVYIQLILSHFSNIGFLKNKINGGIE